MVEILQDIAKLHNELSEKYDQLSMYFELEDEDEDIGEEEYDED